MTFGGVPIFDWLVLAFALGLGVEAWITCRPRPDHGDAGKPVEGEDGKAPRA